MAKPRNPSLYQINTRIWLQEMSQARGNRVTLDQVPDEALDRIADLGFDWVWLLGIWQTGPVGRAIAGSFPQWRRAWKQLLPDFTEEDITGSPFAIKEYRVHEDFGDDIALSQFHKRLQQRGLRLMLDFVPNHTARDHAWVEQHPEYYIAGHEIDLTCEPHNYCRLTTRLGPKILAHGRDPYFPGWTDSVQLNYRSLALRQAMIATLLQIGGMCDGVRCDMAMLLLPEVIERTWGNRSLPADGSFPVDTCFWPEAIAAVRARFPEFLFLAEVYWDLEWQLQQQGFDYTYDKRLYDRLRTCDAVAVRSHLSADGKFQSKCARFLENHDEPRAAAVFPPDVHRAAATITYLLPGMRFFHEGQLEIRRHHVPIHLGRRPIETPEPGLQQFYSRLLQTLRLPVLREGTFQMLTCFPAWYGNHTCNCFITSAWEDQQGERLLITVNYGPTPGQCYVRLPWPDLVGRTYVLRDQMGDATYLREGEELFQRGLYLDIPAWGYHVFELKY